jgi:acetylglutamate kinase
MSRTVVKNRRREPKSKIVVLKFGGELLEDATRLAQISRAIARISRQQKLVVVHGGGREIDAALAQASIPKHQVDGLRITDEQTLQVVVAVLAGSINTRFVAAINAVGGAAVGLTGADAGVAPVQPAGPHKATNGEFVDLGLVGEPTSAGRPSLVEMLCAGGYVPVIACIGASRDGRLFNVNADTLAGSLAARLSAVRLVVAGGTAGVLDANGHTLLALDSAAVEQLLSSGTATAGMVAKLRACREAARGGVGEVLIGDARNARALAALVSGTRKASVTRVTD